MDRLSNGFGRMSLKRPRDDQDDDVADLGWKRDQKRRRQDPASKRPPVVLDAPQGSPAGQPPSLAPLPACISITPPSNPQQTDAIASLPETAGTTTSSQRVDASLESQTGPNLPTYSLQPELLGQDQNPGEYRPILLPEHLSSENASPLSSILQVTASTEPVDVPETTAVSKTTLLLAPSGTENVQTDQCLQSSNIDRSSPLLASPKAVEELFSDQVLPENDSVQVSTGPDIVPVVEISPLSSKPAGLSPSNPCDIMKGALDEARHILITVRELMKQRTVKRSPTVVGILRALLGLQGNSLGPNVWEDFVKCLDKLLFVAVESPWFMETTVRDSHYRKCKTIPGYLIVFVQHTNKSPCIREAVLAFVEVKHKTLTIELPRALAGENKLRLLHEQALCAHDKQPIDEPFESITSTFIHELAHLADEKCVDIYCIDGNADSTYTGHGCQQLSYRQLSGKGISYERIKDKSKEIPDPFHNAENVSRAIISIYLSLCRPELDFIPENIEKGTVRTRDTEEMDSFIVDSKEKHVTPYLARTEQPRSPMGRLRTPIKDVLEKLKDNEGIWLRVGWGGKLRSVFVPDDDLL